MAHSYRSDINEGRTAESAGNVFIRQTTKTIIDAQIKTLPTASVELIPAQSGCVSVIVSALARFVWTANYTNINAASVLSISSSNGTDVAGPLSETISGGVSALLAAGSNQFAVFPQLSAVGSIFGEACSGYDDVDLLNTAIKLQLINGAGSNLTGGNVANRLIISVAYTIFNSVTGLFLTI